MHCNLYVQHRYTHDTAESDYHLNTEAGRLAVATPHAHFIVKNVGSGPALNTSFDFVPVDPKTSTNTDPNRYARGFPHMAPPDTPEAPMGLEIVRHGDYTRYGGLFRVAYAIGVHRDPKGWVPTESGHH